ncbi:MAG: transglycosylase SLT domain-containing protein [Treponema sp.]|jgi:membrane-bound lytic murein transglycosylase D|nr:transglycosylase SLT domain-containing protein [Treponema sp.]
MKENGGPKILKARRGKLLAFLLFAGVWSRLLAADSIGSADRSNAAGFPAAAERPLRGVPVYFSLAPLRHSPDQASFTSNSLLSLSALEQPLTQYYIRQYSSFGGISWLNAVMRRGSVYLPFIKEEITKRNLPPELLYLPVIESGFQASARSRSGAVGLWQFMLNSIGPYNMKVNDLMDERRDFQKSTVGALRKLEENYKTLGDWPLALAAYNAGLGGINRVVRQTGSRDYWLLSAKKELKTETIQYVPKLLAVAWILSQPRRFGVDFWPETVEWTTIPVGRQASLDIIAAEAGIDRETLRLGNMELLHGITPPDGAYRLKVPVNVYPLVTEVLEREDLKLLQYYRYSVKYGDTLSALARHYGVSLNLIEQYNPGIMKRYLKIGETIIIPAFKETGPYQGGAVGSQAVVSAAERPFTGTYVVKKGDSLWSLALAYKVDPLNLADANGMGLNQILPEGKQLKVPIN